MALKELWFQHIRNLTETELQLAPQLNWFGGDNGAGKTSVLEAVFLLGHGRSFRTSSIERVVANGQPHLAVSAALAEDGSRLGIQRQRDGQFRIRIDGEEQRKLSSLALRCPVQVLTPDTYALLAHSPRERRRFLDWAVFHVEHDYTAVMLRYGRLLEQRNALLKQGCALDELAVWDHQLAQAGEQVQVLRAAHFAEFQSKAMARINALLPELDIRLDWFRGWAAEHGSLLEALAASRDRDCVNGSTQAGPHRGDLKVRVGRIVADEVLSRGQTKLLIQSLYLAQLDVVLVAREQAGVLLLDDVQSELDSRRQQQFLEAALGLNRVQVLLTATVSGPPELFKRYNTATFHVEHGRVNALP